MVKQIIGKISFVVYMVFVFLFCFAALVLISMTILRASSLPPESYVVIIPSLTEMELNKCFKVRPGITTTLAIEPDKIYWILPGNNKKYCSKNRQNIAD